MIKIIVLPAGPISEALISSSMRSSGVNPDMISGAEIHIQISGAGL